MITAAGSWQILKSFSGLCFAESHRKWCNLLNIFFSASKADEKRDIVLFSFQKREVVGRWQRPQQRQSIYEQTAGESDGGDTSRWVSHDIWVYFFRRCVVLFLAREDNLYITGLSASFISNIHERSQNGSLKIGPWIRQIQSSNHLISWTSVKCNDDVSFALTCAASLQKWISRKFCMFLRCWVRFNSQRKWRQKKCKYCAAERSCGRRSQILNIFWKLFDVNKNRFIVYKHEPTIVPHFLWPSVCFDNFFCVQKGFQLCWCTLCINRLKLTMVATKGLT